MRRYTIFVYFCQCSTRFERGFLSVSGAQKLCAASPKLAVTANKFGKYSMLHVEFLSSWCWEENPLETCRAL